MNLGSIVNDGVQDVFIIPEGAPGALAELERRKFTAEEGVRFVGLLLPLASTDQAFVRITLLS